MQYARPETYTKPKTQPNQLHRRDMTDPENTKPIKPPVIGLILSGGLGTRMGHSEKGLVAFNGSPLINFALQAVLPLCDSIAISCNAHQENYRKVLRQAIAETDAEHRKVPRLVNQEGLIHDQCAPIAGPVAGIISCLIEIENSKAFSPEALTAGTMVVTSCDMPFLCKDALEELISGASAAPQRAHYYASRLADSQKHHYLPVAFGLGRAIQCARDWREWPESTPRRDFSLRNWLAALSEDSSQGLITEHDYEDRSFTSINSSQQLQDLQNAVGERKSRQ